METALRASRVIAFVLCGGLALSCVAGDWRDEANARIDSLRKRDLRIRVVDAEGQALPGVALHVRQTRSRFAFGSALAREALDIPAYAEFFAEHFEWAVFEADAKWKFNEVEQGVLDYDVADALVLFCQERGIRMRGHQVFWAKPDHVQAWVKALDDAGLQEALQARIDSVVPRYSGAFEHWDVNNELAHGSYFGGRLGPSVRSWMFQEVRSQDPDVQLFVNDYSVINRGEVDSFLRYTQAILDGGGEVDGLGVQGHYYEPVDPVALLERFDALAAFGLPVWVTEFDYSNPDAGLRADSLEALHRVAFSHPAVEGVLLWGFWAGRHWRGESAALLNLDFSLNAAGRRYLELRAEWTTDHAESSDAEGEVRLRGFHGTYEIEIRPGWEPGSSVSLELAPDPAGREDVLVVELGVPADENTWLLKATLAASEPTMRELPELFAGEGAVALDLLGPDGEPGSGDDDAHGLAQGSSLSLTWSELPGALVVFELAHPSRELRLASTQQGVLLSY